MKMKISFEIDESAVSPTVESIKINGIDYAVPAPLYYVFNKMAQEYDAMREVDRAARMFADCYITKDPDDRETKALFSALQKLDEARRG
jgi:hypothetical protein